MKVYKNNLLSIVDFEIRMLVFNLLDNIFFPKIDFFRDLISYLENPF